MELKFGSVCSGIEAASTAWEPLGWKPSWFAEIDPFPSKVLAHNWPEVPNLGDFTAIRNRIAAGEIEAPDVLVGGTPCQAFSVAGLRRSLDDQRGQLTLQFVGLANAINAARSVRGLQPVTAVWENVPGVLNTPDNAFGCFLAGLVGEDDPLVAPGGRWTNVGYVRGPRRTVAWRILDAQYFGVAQRRRRVFVVASAGGLRPERVLFELDGVRRDSPPRREAGQGSSHDVAPCLTSGGRGVERTVDTRGQDPVVAVMHHGQGDAEICENASPTLTCNHEAPIVSLPEQPRAWAIQERAAHPNLNAGPGGKGFQEGVAYTLEARHHVQAACVTGDVFHTLRAEGHDASEDGTGRGVGAVAVAFSSKDYGADASEGFAPTMRSMGHNESHANGGGQLAVAMGFNARQDPDSWEGRTGPLDTDGSTQAVALSLHENQRHELTLNDTAGTVKCAGGKPGQGYPAALVGMQVRRLTPTECERLQGFPDGHTRIPWRGKGTEECPNGPRYKALGNSMAVPVMRWIGARIDREMGDGNG